MYYLGGIWRRLEQLERIYGRFPSVDQSGRFAGVPNLGKPLYREKTVYIKTHKTAINRDVTHILSKVSCFLLQSFHFRRLHTGYRNDRFIFSHTNPYILNVTQQCRY